MRYLFCVMASHGYVYPAIGLAKQLKQRGHQVKFVTNQSFSDILQQFDLLRLSRGDEDGPSFQVPQWGEHVEILRQVQHVTHACQIFQPNVLVSSQLALGPLLVAKASKRPVAVLGFGTYLWPKGHIEPAQQSNLDRERAFMHAQTLQAYYKAHARVMGLSLHSNSADDKLYQNSPLLGDIYLLRSIPELEPNADRLPPSVKMAGDCLWEPDATPDSELNEIIYLAKSANHKIIYVQYQSAPIIPDYWPNLVQALHNEPVQVIAATGKHQIDRQCLPPNFFVRSHISHKSILPHANVVITAGTSSTMLGALSHGIPLLLLPYTSENPEVALRCEYANVAISLSPFDRYSGTPLPENITPEALKQALNQLLDETSSLYRAAQRIKDAFDTARKKNVAIELLEQLADDKLYVSSRVTVHQKPGFLL